METDLSQIESLTIQFLDNIELSDCPKGKCFTTCYPLSIFLKRNKIPTLFFQGYYKTQENVHYWLTLQDSETIIDPTIRQFDKNKPRVFIGKDSDYKNCNVLEAIDDPIYRWKLPFIELTNEIEKSLIPPCFDKKTNLKIILQAATFLHLNLKKDFTEKEKEYFSYIKSILNYEANRPLINEMESKLLENIKTLESDLNTIVCH